jgi:hypothetical protein
MNEYLTTVDLSLAVTASVSVLWPVQRFHMTMADVPLTNNAAMLEETKTKRLTSVFTNWWRYLECRNLQLHASCSSKTNCEMKGHHDTGNMKLPKPGSVKVRIQMLKRPQSVVIYRNLTRCACQWSNVEKQVTGVS